MTMNRTVAGRNCGAKRNEMNQWLIVCKKRK
jgi:hypothetical protein